MEKIEAGQGKGLGFAQFENEFSYCAVVAHVSVEEEVRLLRMWAAVDAGLAINPGGIVAQVEGGMIQAASWTLREAVPTEGRRIISESWKDYPILRFDEIPEITVRSSPAQQIRPWEWVRWPWGQQREPSQTRSRAHLGSASAICQSRGTAS